MLDLIASWQNGDFDAEDELKRIARRTPDKLGPYLRSFVESSQPIRTIAPAFRAASMEDIDFLFSELQNKDITPERRRALITALTHTRGSDTLNRLANHPQGATWYFREVGFEWTRNGLRRLFPDVALQVAFPSDLRALVAPYKCKDETTWASPVDARYLFGGSSAAHCGQCHGPLDRLVRLDPMPVALGLSTTRLELATCLGCAFELNGCGGAFYVHDETGAPSPYEPLNEDWPQHAQSSFLERPTDLIALGSEYWLRSWGATEGDNLTRVGGPPSWIQDAGYQACPKCEQTMMVIAQFDSGLPDTNGRPYDWANGGMAYVSFCDECRISHMQIQNT